MRVCNSEFLADDYALFLDHMLRSKALGRLLACFQETHIAHSLCTRDQVRSSHMKVNKTQLLQIQETDFNHELDVVIEVYRGYPGGPGGLCLHQEEILHSEFRYSQKGRGGLTL